MMGLQYWVCLALICLAGTNASPTLANEISIEPEESITDGEILTEGSGPCECQCQCDYSNGAGGRSEVLVDIDQRLADIQEAVEKQSLSITVIDKQVSAVQHDLESPRNPECPEEFLFDKQTNMCFKLHVNRVTWAEAQRSCQHLGPKTHLAVVDTEERRELIVQHLRQADNLPPSDDRHGWDFSIQVWLGGMQGKNEGPWFWTASGQEFAETTNTLWGPGEPNDSGGDGDRVEDCLNFARGPAWPTWYINDSDCADRLIYLCEYDMGQH